MNPFPIRGLWLERWLPLLLWCGLVVYFSSDRFAWGETSRWITPMLLALFPDATPETLDLLHTFVRKLAHVFEFGVMGLLATRATRSGEAESGPQWPALAFVVLVAMLDESRQALTALRGPSVIDVGYDTLGGVLGLGLGSLRGLR